MKRRRAVRRLAAGLALIAGIVVIGAPMVRLERFREPIRKGLELALERVVEINGPVRLRVLPSPGVSLTNVVIHDDPAISLEPIAYVSELGVGVSPLGPIRGRIQFDSLRLIRPSVNLVKSPDGAWNYPRLLDQVFSGSVPRRIEVRSGRLNFRFTDVKSVFYLSDADVDIVPERASLPVVRFRFSGSPSRTDRAAQGFGKLSGNGRHITRQGQESLLRFVVRLERSAIPDILTLLQGHGTGLGGFVASRAEFEGPPSALRFNGEMQLVDVDRRFLLPSGSGEWALNYTGRLDLVGQVLELDTARAEETLPVSVRLRVSDYLSRPRWALAVAAERLPVETLPALAAEMGIPVPPQLRPAGSLTGSVSYGSFGVLRGGLQLEDPVIRGADGEVLRLEPIAVTVDAKSWRLRAVPTAGEAKADLGLKAAFSLESGALELQLSARRLDLVRFQNVWREYMDAELPAVFDRWDGGAWSGELLFRRSPEQTGWEGEVAVERASLSVPGLSVPVQVDRAEGGADASSLRIEGSAGQQQFIAIYDAPAATLSLELDEVLARDLEDLFTPALSWQRGFLERALRIGSGTMPQWLRKRNLSGDFRLGSFRAPPVILTDLAGRYRWDGPSLTLFLDEASSDGGALSGLFIAGMHTGRPNYSAELTVSDYPWQGGVLRAAGEVTASGTGPELLAGAAASGLFTLQFPGQGTHSPFRSLHGCFDLPATAATALLEFPCLELRSGDHSFAGRGWLEGSGRIELELYQNGRPTTAKGVLSPFRIEIDDAAGTIE